MARPLLRGDRLQAAREAMGLTREQLAKKLELSSPSRIRVWETGLERPRRRPPAAAARAACLSPRGGRLSELGRPGRVRPRRSTGHRQWWSRPELGLRSGWPGRCAGPGGGV